MLRCSYILFPTFIFQGWHLYFATSSKNFEKHPLCGSFSVKTYLAVRRLHALLHKDYDLIITCFRNSRQSLFTFCLTRFIIFQSDSWSPCIYWFGCRHNGYWKGQYLTHAITILLGSQILPRGPKSQLKDTYSNSHQWMHVIHINDQSWLQENL